MAYNVKLNRETAGTVFGLPEDDIRYLDVVVECASCGKTGASSDYLNLIVGIGSLGHHSLTHLKRGPGEQWACSLDCWEHIYVDRGNELIGELIEMNAAEERSDHHVRANSRIESGEPGLLTKIQRTDSPA